MTPEENKPVHISRMNLCVSLDYPPLFQHGLRITGVSELVVSASSCCTVKFYILSCYCCSHLLEASFFQVPVCGSAIRSTLIGTTLSAELWFQRNGEKTFVCWSAYGGTNNKNVGTQWMFSQRWPTHCISFNVKTTLFFRPLMEIACL